MKEAIVYGGAFNPPTIAHQVILQGCVNRAEQAGGEVWLIPSGDRRDKTISTTREQRLRLVEALCSSVVMKKPGIVRIDTLELDTPALTETFETHAELVANNPGYDIKWVFGSDSVGTMSTWQRGDWLQKNLGMLVIQRPGSELCELPSRAEQLSIAVPNVSSTLVRNKIAFGEPIADLVPLPVACMLQ